MLEDEAITVYTFLVVVPILFWGNRTNKSDIAYLPTYVKWIYKSLQTSLGYGLEKMLDISHRGIRLIVAEQQRCHPSLKELATEMDLRYVDFIPALDRCVDDTYESLLAGVNGKEGVWWITTPSDQSLKTI